LASPTLANLVCSNETSTSLDLTHQGKLASVTPD
jgi:hypothetical protein